MRATRASSRSLVRCLLFAISSLRRAARITAAAAAGLKQGVISRDPALLELAAASEPLPEGELAPQLEKLTAEPAEPTNAPAAVDSRSLDDFAATTAALFLPSEDIARLAAADRSARAALLGDPDLLRWLLGVRGLLAGCDTLQQLHLAEALASVAHTVEFGRVDLAQRARAVLAELAALLRRHADLEVVVEGHAQSGAPPAPPRSSRGRAAAVVAELARGGVAHERSVCVRASQTAGRTRARIGRRERRRRAPPSRRGLPLPERPPIPSRPSARPCDMESRQPLDGATGGQRRRRIGRRRARRRRTTTRTRRTKTSPPTRRPTTRTEWPVRAARTPLAPQRRSHPFCHRGRVDRGVPRGGIKRRITARVVIGRAR